MFCRGPYPWCVGIATIAWLYWIGPMLVDLSIVLLVGSVVLLVNGVVILIVGFTAPLDPSTTPADRLNWICKLLGGAFVGQAWILVYMGYMHDDHRARFLTLIALTMLAVLACAFKVIGRAAER